MINVSNDNDRYISNDPISDISNYPMLNVRYQHIELLNGRYIELSNVPYIELSNESCLPFPCVPVFSTPALYEYSGFVDDRLQIGFDNMWNIEYQTGKI